MARSARCRWPACASIAAPWPTSRRSLGALFILAGAGYLLKAWNLLYSTSGVVFGAGYTDVHVRLPLIRALMVLAFLLGGALIYNAVRGRRKLWPPLAIGVWIVALIVLLAIVPAIWQALAVNPNQLTKETPYIANDIAATRAAYDLTAISETPYSLEGDLTAAQLQVEQRDDKQCPSLGSGGAAHQLRPAPGTPAVLLVRRASASIATLSTASTPRPCSLRASCASPVCRPRRRPG